MVTAGVFLTCRFSPLFESAPQVSNLVLMVGALTAFFAATTALVQNDIKRIIAYSTCSQLGFMFAAVGAGFYQAAMFHLFTHAFFKALLFLGAGSVIHAMHHEQDVRRFGGLRSKLPITFLTMTAGTLAITGVGIPLSYYFFGFNFGLSGFVSKDIIIEGVFASKNSYSYHAFIFLIFSALLTAFYSWRLIFLTFFGSFRGNKDDFNHCHEPEKTMLIPLAILALGAVFFGSFFELYFTSAKNHIFSDSILLSTNNTILKDFHYVPVLVKVAPFFAMLVGLSTAIYFYLISPEIPRRLANQQPILYNFLLNKWYFDEVYNFFFVSLANRSGNLFWKVGDIKIINGSIHGLGLLVVPYFVAIASRLQSGFVFHYALVMIIGFTAILSFFIICR
jgi:NADH-quinone oxidoreductase subunit L